MKTTSPLVIAMLFASLGQGIKLATENEGTNFLSAHDYDVAPHQAPPAVQASPVKTSIKGEGCNAANCPSTGPSCCMVSPGRNMTPGSLGTLAQTHDYDVAPHQAQPAVQASPVKTTIKGAGCNAANCPSTGPSCCMVSPDRNMTPGSLGRALVQKDGETEAKVVEGEKKTEAKVVEGEKKTEAKVVEGEKKTEAKVVEGEKKTEAKVVEGEKKTEETYIENLTPPAHCCDPSIDGTVEKCQKEKAQGVPYCAHQSITGTAEEKVAEKKDEVKGEVVTAEPKVETSEPKTTLSQVKDASGDYDIQNPTLKVKDVSSPVKTSIKGRGCTTQNCDSTRAPCCKVVPEVKEEVKPAVAKETVQPSLIQKNKPDAGHHVTSDPSPVSCKNVQNCPALGACCFQPGHPGVKALVQANLAQEPEVQVPAPSQQGWNTQMNAIKDANKAQNVTKCTNSSHKCSDIGGKRQSNSDDTCCQEPDDVEADHVLPKYPYPTPPSQKEGKEGEQKVEAKK